VIRQVTKILEEISGRETEGTMLWEWRKNGRACSRMVFKI
jgi:hypothetical protein